MSKQINNVVLCYYPARALLLSTNVIIAYFNNGRSRSQSTRGLSRLDFRRSLVSGLPSPRRVRWRSAGSFTEQRLVIESRVAKFEQFLICFIPFIS